MNSFNWGEIVEAVRSAHEAFEARFRVPPALFAHDIPLRHPIPFPDALGTISDRDWSSHPLELHPVERALLEGPLLPIDEVKMSPNQLDALLESIVALEDEWLVAIRFTPAPTALEFLKENLHSRWASLRTRTRATHLKMV